MKVKILFEEPLQYIDNQLNNLRDEVNDLRAKYLSAYNSGKSLESITTYMKQIEELNKKIRDLVMQKKKIKPEVSKTKEGVNNGAIA
jgi:flagellar biosynthesis chaperone FliJ